MCSHRSSACGEALKVFSILSLFFLLSCGDSEQHSVAADPTLRPILLRALAQARQDSAMLAGATFQAQAAMTFELNQSDDHVRIEDSLLLKKDTATGYIAEQRSHVVDGDTSLLKNMYSFEDARGNARGAERAHLASLDFGTSFPSLLHYLLTDSTESTGYALEDSAARVGTHQSSIISYTTPEKSGRFWIDNRTSELVRLEVRQQSNYVVGSYDYRAAIDFDRPDGALLLPVKTDAHFDYRRVFTNGTGTIIVVLDSVSVDEHPKQTQ